MVAFYNDSGEEIPAFALMRITGMDAEGFVTVAKPNSNSQMDILVNGPVPIPIAMRGEGHCDSPCAVLYDTGDGTPAIGEEWGAESGSWKANKTRTGAVIIGGHVGGIVTVRHGWCEPAWAGVTVAEVDGTPSYTGISILTFDQADGFVVTNPSAGTARIDYTYPGFAVREVDGSPSYTGITTVEYDQTDGFVVTNPSAGVARVDVTAASLTTVGIITTGEQNVTGLKRFNANIYVVPIGAPPASIIHLGSDPSLGGSYATITTTYVSSSYYVMELLASTNAGTDTINLVLQPDAGQIQLATNHVSDYPVITMGRSGSTLTGVTGSYTNATITVTGGVVTSASSGGAITSLGGLTGATQTFANDTNVTITSSGTTHTLGWSGQLSLARGGTGANLSDPNADRILFWDDSGGAVTWLTVGSGLDITTTTLSAASSVAGWVKVTKSYTDFSAAATSNTITAHVLPARGYIQAIIIKHSTAFSGGGSTSYNLDCGYTGTTTAFVTAFDVFQAVSDTAFSNSTPAYFNVPGINITLTANSNVNLNLVTAGSVDVWLLVSTLP